MPKCYSVRKCFTLIMLWTLCTGCFHGETGVDASGAGTPHNLMNAPKAIITASLELEDIRVEIALTNRSSTPFPLLKWNLPSNGELTSDLFEVERNGQSESYKGKLVKRRVTADDYIWLQPGKEYRTTINLQQGYDVRLPGRYEIAYRAWNQLRTGGVVAIASPKITIERP
jgi:hypothetical protein